MERGRSRGAAKREAVPREVDPLAGQRRRVGDEDQPRQVAHRGIGQDPRVPGADATPGGKGETETGTKGKGGAQTQADEEALDPLEDDDRNVARSQSLLALEVVDDCPQPRPLL